MSADPPQSIRNDPAGKDLQQAIALHRAGRVPEAEALYRKILRDHPSHPDALHLLGLIAHQAGHTQAARDLVTQAIRHRPNAPPFLNSLGIICLARGELDQASAAFRKAISLAPGYGEPHLNLGNLHRLQGNKVAAEQCFRQAIACNPKLIEAHNNLGTLLIELDRAEEAIAELEAALGLKPGDPQILCNLGTARDALGRADAVDCFRQVLASRPDDLKALTGLGKLYVEREYADEAAECFERAIALEPAVLDHRMNLATARAKQHRFDEARQLLAAVIAADPNRAAAYFGLGRICVALGDFEGSRGYFRRAHDADPLDANAMGALLDDREVECSDKDRQQAELILGRAETPFRPRLYLHFALAHALERAGRYDEAFHHFRTGNSLRRANLIRLGKAYDPVAQERMTEQVMARYDASFFGHDHDVGDPSELPIFIVGMPRSGTTLCEQILASHPSVHGAGELPDIADIAARLDAFEIGKAGRALPDNWRHESNAHIARLHLLAPNASRVTDKAPGNFLHLGLIASLFPQARIVHCTRSVVDTGLSCYAHNLGDHWNWACDLEWIAHYARQYRRLMGHWRAVLPVPVLEFNYEDLVGDFEIWARKLVDFCGLAWAPECADFYRTERPVFTASQQQVRQPLYAGSVEKWRRYERHLEPLIGELGSAS